MIEANQVYCFDEMSLLFFSFLMAETSGFTLRHNKIVCPLHPKTPLYLCACLGSLKVCDEIGADPQVSTLCRDIRQRCEKLPRFLEFSDLTGRQRVVDRLSLNPWLREDIIRKMKTEESTPLIDWIDKVEVGNGDLGSILSKADLITFDLLIEDVLNIIPIVVTSRKPYVSVVVGQHPHYPDSRCFRLQVSRIMSSNVISSQTSETRRAEYLDNFRKFAKGKVNGNTDSFRPLPLCDPIDFLNDVSPEMQTHHIVSLCGLLQAHSTALANYVEATTVGTNPQLTFGIQEEALKQPGSTLLSRRSMELDSQSHQISSISFGPQSTKAHPVFLSENDKSDSDSSDFSIRAAIPDFVELPATIKNIVCPYTRCDLPDLSELINVLRRSITMMLLPGSPDHGYIQQTHHSLSDTTSRSKTSLDHATDYFVVVMNRILVLVTNIISNLFIRFIESMHLTSAQFHMVLNGFRIVSPQIYNGWVPLQIHLMQSSNINVLPTFTALTQAASLQSSRHVAEEELDLGRKELEVKKMVASKQVAAGKRN